MAKKAISVTIDKAGFRATETFMSRADGEAWKQMLETLLEHREKVTFDLAVHAAGLAETVRSHGGAYTQERWLAHEVPADQWAKGLPVALDYEAMIRDVLAGRKLKSPNEYK